MKFFLTLELLHSSMRDYTNYLLVFILAVSCSLYHCTPNPFAKTNRQYRKQAKMIVKSIRAVPQIIVTDSMPKASWQVGTTNFNLRKPNFVIIHHTAQNSCLQTLQTFTLPRTQVSAHYVICKDGSIYHMLNDYLRAWHGGIGKWGSLTDINSSSLGIELDNNGFEPFPSPQLSSLLVLLDTLKSRYSIPAANFVGHADIAPTRKNDPNIYFPWKLLSDKGFGTWYTDTTGILVPENFNNIQALRIIGYDVTDSIAAILAFKRHFVQDTTPVINERDVKILYNLSKSF
ncbi:MAG: N-acetylmuramoyl-L-alanine amidase [Chitinophagaceae bacterium]